MKVIYLDDYAKAMQELYPLDFGPTSTIPEFNTDVIAQFIYYCRYYHFDSLFKLPIYIHGGLAFQQDQWDENNLHIPLGPVMCHSCVPYSSSELVAGITGFHLELYQMGMAKTIAPETLQTDDYLTDAPYLLEEEGKKAGHFIWLNSPVVEITDTFDDYLASLKSSRRRKARQVLEAHKDVMVMTVNNLGQNHIEFALQNLRKRWQEEGDEYVEFASLQFLWSLAVASCGNTYFQIFYRGGEILAVSHHVNVSGQMIYQGIAKDEDKELNNIGIFAFLSIIRYICEHPQLPIDLFDPTCKTGFIESTADVYKRSVVNKDCLKPTFFSATSEEVKPEYIQPPYYVFGANWTYGSDKYTTAFEGV